MFCAIILYSSKIFIFTNINTHAIFFIHNHATKSGFVLTFVNIPIVFSRTLCYTEIGYYR